MNDGIICRNKISLHSKELNSFLTESPLDSEWQKKLEEAGVEVITAGA